MTVSLGELERLAGEASPRPWEWVEDTLCFWEPYTDESKGRGSREVLIQTDSGVYPPFGADRDFIAALANAYEALRDVAVAARELLPFLPDIGETKWQHPRAANKLRVALAKVKK